MCAYVCVFSPPVQFSCSVMSDPLWPHELQHTRPSCPSSTPGVHPNPCYEHPGLISFRMEWLDLLAIQGTLKSLLQHHSSKASILLCSTFLTVQLSHPYMTTGKTIALTRRTFVGKVMSLLLSMLSRLLITFLPRSKHLLNFMAAVTICSDFRAQENKACHCFHCFPIYLPWSNGTGCHDLRLLDV